jgi:hypothetical protein
MEQYQAVSHMNRTQLDYYLKAAQDAAPPTDEIFNTLDFDTDHRYGWIDAPVGKHADKSFSKEQSSVYLKTQISASPFLPLVIGFSGVAVADEKLVDASATVANRI